VPAARALPYTEKSEKMNQVLGLIFLLTCK
jgi:hypothetical protein